VKCNIYRCSKKQEMYLYLPFAEDDLLLIKDLPAELLEITGRLQKVMELEITEQRKLARANAAEVIASLSNKGFYLQMPPSELLLRDTSMLSDDSDSF
jgi:uncharacterized protein YcgL (UPF0745 family)